MLSVARARGEQHVSGVSKERQQHLVLVRMCQKTRVLSHQRIKAGHTAALHNLPCANKAEHRVPPTFSGKPHPSSVCETTKNTASVIYSQICPEGGTVCGCYLGKQRADARFVHSQNSLCKGEAGARLQLV